MKDATQALSLIFLSVLSPFKLSNPSLLLSRWASFLPAAKTSLARPKFVTSCYRCLSALPPRHQIPEKPFLSCSKAGSHLCKTFAATSINPQRITSKYSKWEQKWILLLSSDMRLGVGGDKAGATYTRHSQHTFHRGEEQVEKPHCNQSMHRGSQPGPAQGNEANQEQVLLCLLFFFFRFFGKV